MDDSSTKFRYLSVYQDIKDKIEKCTQYPEVRRVIDDWMDYYNNERYQWKLAKLSPNEYYEYIKTGIYPLKGYIPSVNIGEEGRK